VRLTRAQTQSIEKEAKQAMHFAFEEKNKPRPLNRSSSEKQK
jgi:hypothetical protein